MFRKYEKTYRILLPEIKFKGKHFLVQKEIRALLTGKVTITEKMDGANVGIIRTSSGFRLQKRGSLVDASEHEQFNFFKAWAWGNYQKLMSIPPQHIVYGELMRCRHGVLYDKLPDWFLVFAIFSISLEKYIPWAELTALCEATGLETVPLIKDGTYLCKNELISLIPDTSAYSTHPAEGIVIWNYRKQMRGKIVKQCFLDHMEDSQHWSQQSITLNQLNK